MAAMPLAELAARLQSDLSDLELFGDDSVELQRLSFDSRQIAPGDLFAALPGRLAHGLDFLDQALARGAAAVLSDQAPEQIVPALVSSRPRRAAALAAWALAGDPQRRLHLAGVTGTNGKSTVTRMLGQILETAGQSALEIGTVDIRYPGYLGKARLTTPEAAELAELFKAAVEAGAQSAVFEVSSQALVMERTAGLEFSVCVFTNLSRDHLDEHGDLESYFEVKSRLFCEQLATDGLAVLPADDPWADRLAEMIDDDRLLRYGFEAEAEIRAEALQSDLDGSHFELWIASESAEVDLPQIGEHNLRNALAAAGAAHVLGVPITTIAAGLTAARGVCGRLERLEIDHQAAVFVDYAHTPDALSTILEALRPLCTGRLICVFGAGGDRDPGKRGPMGAAVGQRADLALVTSDNPRSEDPSAIAAALAEGVRQSGQTPEVILDRERAITRALEIAGLGDVIVIAGKGHEAEQIDRHGRRPFSDHQVALAAARRLACG